MSKSLKRVRQALEAADIKTEILEMPGETRTAQQAAMAAGCLLDQIAKSVIFCAEQSNRAVLFLTAGGNQVDPAKAGEAAGEPLGKADAQLIRAQTGFAIGGVSPIGHVSPIRAFMDPRLLDFAEIWAAAGTPRHIFPVSPQKIREICNAQIIDFTT